jgi:hypothetical protein
MISVRGGSGLGDSLYVQSIARHLVEQGHQVEACSNWPEVFRPLNGRCVVSPFRRDRVDRLAHYSMRKGMPQTDQFVDCCLQAGIRERIELRLDWLPENAELISLLGERSCGRPVVIVQLPRSPMGRSDGYGAELLPDCRVIQRVIDRLRPRAFIVQVGKGDGLFQFSNLDLDLANRTSVADLIDVAYAADGCLGYCSFMVPLAESLGKPGLIVWSRRGLRANINAIAARTPEKVIHRHDLLRHVIDDCPDAQLNQAADALLDAIRTAAVV